MDDFLKSQVLKNRILETLPPDEVKALLPDTERVDLRFNDVLFRPGEAARFVYFPQDSVISTVVTMADGKSVEVGLIGLEGVAGVHAVLGNGTYLYTASVQIPGSCLRIGTEAFEARFRVGGALRDAILKYLQYLLVQVSQTAACNRVHRVKQRLARRLLMLQDRVKEDHFPLTHEFSAYMLGTPRSEVSVAADSLRKSKIIDYARGKVTILRREKLEKASCECYGAIHQEFLRLT
jgi:CRP-like cAMP-binding protein